MASRVNPSMVQPFKDYPHCKVDFPSQRFTVLKNLALTSFILGIYFYIFECCLK